MPTEVKDNLKSSPQEDNKTQELKIEAEKKTTSHKIQVKERTEDSLHGSQCSLNSNSDSSRSDRESSARSTRTDDSGLGELEDDPNIITESSATSDKQKMMIAEERPPTPGLFLFDLNSLPATAAFPKVLGKRASHSVLARMQNCESLELRVLC